MKHLISLFLFISFATVMVAQPGTLDNSFGNEGIVIGQGYTGYAYAAAIQKDGKIIAAGRGTYKTEGGILLVRYNTDGTPDPSFGEQGIVITNLMGPIDDPYSLVLQEDGKILVAGEIGKGFDAGVIRYLPDGTPDSSFGENGGIFTDLGDKEYVSSMALQPDGKIIVAGIQGTRKAFTVRYLPDGSLDESYGNGGNVITTMQYASSINCITVQPNGKIIIAGSFDLQGYARMLLIRNTSSGSLDREFGGDGIVILSFVSGFKMDDLHSIVLQPDGKILIAGSSFEQYDVFMSLARFESDGSLDFLFGNEGKVLTDFKTKISYGNSVLIQPDGKIVASGFASLDYSERYSDFALARYQANGILDSSFGKNGLQITDYGSDGIYANASVLQEDGKIVLVGYNNTTVVLARYNGGDAILPITYNHFTAEQNQQTIALSWQTATEQNNRYFAIERSSNAVNYAAIAQVNSAGTGATVHQYSYTDKLPVPGANYYRLKQTDADGRYSYSKVVSINYLKPGTILLLPNPAKDQLTVKGLNAANTSTVSLLDQQGKLLKQFTVKQSTAYSFSINHLAAGSYIVRVKDNNGVATQKFVKQ